MTALEFVEYLFVGSAFTAGRGERVLIRSNSAELNDTLRSSAKMENTPQRKNRLVVRCK